MLYQVTMALDYGGGPDGSNMGFFILFIYLLCYGHGKHL